MATVTADHNLSTIEQQKYAPLRVRRTEIRDQGGSRATLLMESLEEDSILASFNF